MKGKLLLKVYYYIARNVGVELKLVVGISTTKITCIKYICI